MKRYLLAADQSTSSSKAFLIDREARILRKESIPHVTAHPSTALTEQDGNEILRNVMTALRRVTEGIDHNEIAALALTNQRETVFLRDRENGQPVCPGIVWQDTRGAGLCEELSAHNASVRARTGSDLSPYLPASKVGTLLRGDPALLRRAQNGDLALGTAENLLLSGLTGRNVSDISNAGRTQLMDLRTGKWDPELAELFGIPFSVLPEEILPCDADFGCWEGIPVTGVLGDSFATLFGQGCHAPGSAKISYGTGTSLMVQTGDQLLDCPGLTSAVAWRFRGETRYETEGNITCSGDTLVWLCDTLGLFETPGEIEQLAASVKDSGGVSLVPALSGLGAPFFDPDARALICGLSRGTTRAHVARAALEGMAQRPADVLDAVRNAGIRPGVLMADGGGIHDALLMQLQADLADCPLCCGKADELSALGAAAMAGITVGFFDSFEEFREKLGPLRYYRPRMDKTERERMRSGWKDALRRVR